MPSMPTYDHLHSALGQDWCIHDGGVNVVPVTIVEVEAERAMSAQYAAFHLMVQLPMGSHANQGTYSLVAPDGRMWPIFMSPAAPSCTDQARLQATFSYPIAPSTAV